MTTTSPRVLSKRTLAIGSAAAMIAVGLLAPALTGSAGAHTFTRSTQHSATHSSGYVPLQVDPTSRYLALGDSVPFGYRESNAIDTPNPKKASDAVGFPEDVAANLGLRLTNAACPGETTASFINTASQSNGCENTYSSTSGATNPVPGGYRTAYPLHVKYANAKQSQLAFAEAFLKKHPTTRLVSLMIGANDGFLCQEQTSDGCLSEFSALQAKITKNATKIFKGLRDTAHYTHQIILVTYYSLNYNNELDSVESQGLNAALEKAAKGFHVEIADGYAAFQTAAANAGGDSCAAGLLTDLTTTDPSTAAATCGVHLSPAGAATLAQEEEQSLNQSIG